MTRSRSSSSRSSPPGSRTSRPPSRSWERIASWRSRPRERERPLDVDGEVVGAVDRDTLGTVAAEAPLRSRVVVLRHRDAALLADLAASRELPRGDKDRGFLFRLSGPADLRRRLTIGRSKGEEGVVPLRDPRARHVLGPVDIAGDLEMNRPLPCAICELGNPAECATARLCAGVAL